MCKLNPSRKYIDIFSKINLKSLFCTILMLFCGVSSSAQKLSAKYLEYIDRYKSIAVEHAQEYGVPASITLAQGLLESGAGQSRLARMGHNHFGIKCHRSWQGEKIMAGDSANAICYRQYAKDEDSFLDHALFLKGKRYEKLFALKTTDYKGWAKGLKECGYAEDPDYPALLVKLIERYELFLYDTGQPILAQRKSGKPHREFEEETNGKKTAREQLKKVEFKHYVHRKWGLHYVIAQHGDTYKDIALEFNLKVNKLMEYNDVCDDIAVPVIGERIWVEPKAKHAPERFDIYTVRDGEGIWEISQEFGIRLSSLMKLNGLKKGEDVATGQEIKLR